MSLGIQGFYLPRVSPLKHCYVGQRASLSLERLCLRGRQAAQALFCLCSLCPSVDTVVSVQPLLIWPERSCAAFSWHFGNNSTVLVKYPPLPLQVSEICLQSRPGFGIASWALC